MCNHNTMKEIEYNLMAIAHTDDREIFANDGIREWFREAEIYATTYCPDMLDRIADARATIPWDD